ncbi:achaete-scute complex protein T5-like [Episyrphus balteatus]|uniref:achaete-scute complex protein T5-like n=1 Tax=Episyrphus balteatus TaxID=286459 RepID=UPI0024863715|nr:achaete-scute complex protein T5-like [Episyrphus balteatus]
MALGSERLHHAPQMPLGGNYLKHIPIAPANHLSLDGPRLNKRYVYANKPYGGIETNPSVIRRNARERNRVKQVNNGFVSLRQHIPPAIVADLSNGKRIGGSKKLSKVDTLRMAVEYIRRLKSLLDEENKDSNKNANTSEGFVEDVHQNYSPNPINSMSFYDEQNQGYEHQYYITPSGCQDTTAALVSPTSSNYSDGYFSSAEQVEPKSHIKFENSFDDFNNSAEDEELLDYISLWQEDM